MSSRLENQLRDFDGVAVSILSEARVHCRDMPEYFDELVTLCFDPQSAVANGATWILKAETEDGIRLAPELVERIARSLDRVQSWQAKLHICQSVEGFQPTADQADRFFAWATSLADHPRPFLRAWSLHVRVVLGLKFEKHLRAAQIALAAADDDKAASVRARARQLRKRADRPY